MSMIVDRCCLQVRFIVPAAAELSVWQGMGACGCPISSKVVLMTVASSVLQNKEPVSASEADETTWRKMPKFAWMAPLLMGSSCLSGSVDKKNNPPNLLLALGALR